MGQLATATTTRASDITLRLVHPPGADEKGIRESFASELARALPQEVAKITCIDWREGERGGYLLTSAGAIVHRQMLSDLGLILKGKRFLIIQGHSDCAKSKSECPRFDGELETEYMKRVDRWSKLRLWRNAAILVDQPIVQDAIAAGLKFCVAFHDVHSNQLKFFERETKDLVAARMARPMAREVFSGGELRL